MNIQVNATILFQMVHVVIAYVIVRFVVLKPAMVILDAEEKQRVDLRDVIAYHYTLISREREAAHLLWREGNAFYERHAPHSQDANQVIFKGIYPEQERSHIPDEMIALLTQCTADKLVKKIKTL